MFAWPFLRQSSFHEICININQQFSEEVVSARSLVRNSIEKKLKEEAKLAK